MTHPPGRCRQAEEELMLLQHLYSNPTVSPNNVKDHLGVTHQTASSLVDSFQKAGILKEITGYRRNRLFTFSEYLHLFS